MKDTKFFVCEHCGNLVSTIHSSGVPMICCGQKMTEIVAGTVEASREKHIPVVTVDGKTVKVTVGSVLHPMSTEHSIEWVYLQTCRGGAIKYLSPDAAPETTFVLAEDECPVAVYAYCNLHGLWKTEL